MSSLRTYYGKEVGKERNSNTSGAGTNQVYIPTRPYFKSMHFLRENITPRKTVSNLQDQLEVNEDVADVGNQPSETSAQLTPEKCIFPVENTPSSSKMKKKRSAPLEDELPSNCLVELKQPRQHDASDADSVFSQYVCNQLKNIPEGYNKEMLKLEIQQMIVKVPPAPAKQPLSTISYND